MIGRDLYKKYQAKCADVEHKIEEDVSRFGANSRQSCLNGIIRYINFLNFPISVFPFAFFRFHNLIHSYCDELNVRGLKIVSQN